MRRLTRSERVLVVLGTRSMMEAVRALPVCFAVRSHWPSAHLAVGYFRDTQRALLELCPEISRLVRLSNLKTKNPPHMWRTIRQFLPVLQRMLGYDRIALLHTEDSHWPMPLLARITGAKVFDRRALGKRHDLTPALFYQHITERLLELPLQDGFFDYLPGARLAPEDTKYAQDVFARNGLAGVRTIFMNPYRASKHKGWGLKKYIALARALTALGVRCMMHEKGGPDERLGPGGVRDMEEARSARRELERAGVVLAGRISVRELIALISRCDLIVGEASGPAWIAAALGKPTVVINRSLDNALTAFLTSAPPDSRASAVKHLVILYREASEVDERRLVAVILDQLKAWPREEVVIGRRLKLVEQTALVLDGSGGGKVEVPVLPASVG